MITHGWPGSVFEFYKIIGPLSDPESYGGSADDAFHVVCPSVPGYGWSDAPREPGFDVRRVAAELLDPAALTIVVVGQPEGVVATLAIPSGEGADQETDGAGG